MKTLSAWLLFGVLLGAGLARGQDLPDIAAAHARIVADYQRIAATGDVAAREAAARLTRDAYRLLLSRAEGVTRLSADDLHALGACHEGLGRVDQARAFYTKSL